MEKFKFKVTVTDVYEKEISIDAETLVDAMTSLNEELDACPIETQSNTLISSSRQELLFTEGTWRNPILLLDSNDLDTLNFGEDE